jgi:hypothetical protein
VICIRQSCGNFLTIFIPAALGFYLLHGLIQANSATYDEVAYSRIACHWWLTSDDTEITRMGSPVTFWKLQTTPALFLMQKWIGNETWIQDPVKHLPRLLPWFRYSASWLWFLGLFTIQAWSWRSYNRKAALLSGLTYVLGPNLLAHGSLLTMETPLWTFWTLTFFSLSIFLESRSINMLIIAGFFAGVAFSMKFTAVILPPIFAISLFIIPDEQAKSIRKRTRQAIIQTLILLTVMAISNLVVTGFACIPLSQQAGTHPWLEARFPASMVSLLSHVLEARLPVDMVGFLTQLRYQQSGGPSYLFGQVSMNGWPWYYPITILTKTPVVILVIFAIRAANSLKPIHGLNDKQLSTNRLIPLVILLFIVIACAASKRNYGLRYLLPLSPMAIVWVSGIILQTRGKTIATIMVSLLLISVIKSHPYEITYFNELVGGPVNGRLILADSNLDWGQGLIQLQKIQMDQPELRDITLWYFGDVAPDVYGVSGDNYLIDASQKFTHLPESILDVSTRYTAISTSLINGPWGPSGYFSPYRSRIPVFHTPDYSIQVFETLLPSKQLKN